MSALPGSDDFKIGRAITREEWAELRREALVGVPPELQDRPLAEILLGYQKRALRECLLNSVTFVEKSRRIGLTWAFAAEAVMTAAAERTAGGMDCWYIGYNLEMAREFIDVCGMWAKLFAKAAVEVGEYVFEDLDPATGETRKIQAFRIAFGSGFEIVALPSSPRSLRGKQGLVLIDEAAFHDDLEELLKAAMALLIWGGRVVVISTHDGEMNAFNQRIQAIRAGRYRYGLVRIDFDEALHDGLYQRVCMRAGTTWSPEAEAEWREGVIADYGDAADEELFVIPAEGSGAWLLPAVIEKNMSGDVPVLRWEMPNSFAAEPAASRELAATSWCETMLAEIMEGLDPNLASFFGMDFARVADLSAIWPVQITRTLYRRTPFLVELRNIPFAQQEQVLFWVGDRLPRLAGGAIDAGGNGAALAEAAAQKWGMDRIAQVKFSVDWYRENMPKLKDTLEALGMALPKDADVLGDFRLIKMIDGVARVPAARTVAKGEAAADGKKRKRHGDAAIAAALAHFASLMPVSLYDYRSVGRPDASIGGTDSSWMRPRHDDERSDSILPRFRGGL